MAQKRSTKELGANSGPRDQKELCKPKRTLQKEPSFKKSSFSLALPSKTKKSFCLARQAKRALFSCQAKGDQKETKKRPKRERAWHKKSMAVPGSFKRGQKEGKKSSFKRAWRARLFSKDGKKSSLKRAWRARLFSKEGKKRAKRERAWHKKSSKEHLFLSRSNELF